MAKNARKRQNRTFAVFLFYKQFLRVRKPRLSVSALNLPQTCGFRGKSEFARRFYSKQYLKRGKIAFLPRFPYEHTDGGECGAHKKRRAPKGAPQRGETAASTAKPRARQVSPFLTENSFVSSKEFS